MLRWPDEISVANRQAPSTARGLCGQVIIPARPVCTSLDGLVYAPAQLNAEQGLSPWSCSMAGKCSGPYQIAGGTGECLLIAYKTSCRCLISIRRIWVCPGSPVLTAERQNQAALRQQPCRACRATERIPCSASVSRLPPQQAHGPHRSDQLTGRRPVAVVVPPSPPSLR